jgi:hypothetical protein
MSGGSLNLIDPSHRWEEAADTDQLKVNNRHSYRIAQLYWRFRFRPTAQIGERGARLRSLAALQRVPESSQRGEQRVAYDVMGYCEPCCG